MGQFRAVRDISLYPVDLTDRIEEVEDDGGGTGGSVSHVGLHRRRLSRKMSNTFLEVCLMYMYMYLRIV